MSEDLTNTQPTGSTDARRSWVDGPDCPPEARAEFNLISDAKRLGVNLWDQKWLRGTAAEEVLASDDRPTIAGWTFGYGEVTFRGKTEKMTDKRAAILRALATAKWPMKRKQLELQVWGGYSISREGFSSTLTALRKALRKWAPRGIEPIEATGRGENRAYLLSARLRD